MTMDLCIEKKKKLQYEITTQYLNILNRRNKIAKKSEISKREQIVTKKNEFYIDTCKVMIIVNMS